MKKYKPCRWKEEGCMDSGNCIDFFWVVKKPDCYTVGKT